MTTYPLEELLGTKLRALYQRKKGRDLFDLYYALRQNSALNIRHVIKCFNQYMKFSVSKPPSRKEFILNLKSKMIDSNFTGDTTGLLRPGVNYDPIGAIELVNKKLLQFL